MNKNQNRYIGFWAVLFVVFQMIAFVSPGWITHEKYTASFWIGYVFITVSFVGQLLCALSALKEKNLTKLFYKIPLIRVSYTGLIVSFVVGGACMLISPLPYWIGVIVAVITLAVTALSVLKANVAAEIVADIDEKIIRKTSYIRMLTVEAEGLMARAKTPESKAACKRVYEALRYSDPMSSDVLSSVEGDITLKFHAFVQSVSSNAEDINVLAEDLAARIADRNRLCKLNKN